MLLHHPVPCYVQLCHDSRKRTLVAGTTTSPHRHVAGLGSGATTTRRRKKTKRRRRGSRCRSGRAGGRWWCSCWRSRGATRTRSSSSTRRRAASTKSSPSPVRPRLRNAVLLAVLHAFATLFGLITLRLVAQLGCRSQSETSIWENEHVLRVRSCSAGKPGRQKADFSRRTSSGNWINDRVTWKEELSYKKAMGYI